MGQINLIIQLQYFIDYKEEEVSTFIRYLQLGRSG